MIKRKEPGHTQETGIRRACSSLRMGWLGGEMSLPPKLLRNDALLMPISEAKPRSPRRSRGLL